MGKYKDELPNEKEIEEMLEGLIEERKKEIKVLNGEEEDELVKKLFESGVIDELMEDNKKAKESGLYDYELGTNTANQEYAMLLRIAASRLEKLKHNISIETINKIEAISREIIKQGHEEIEFEESDDFIKIGEEKVYIEKDTGLLYKKGFDDSGLKEAYEIYKRVKTEIKEDSESELESK